MLFGIPLCVEIIYIIDIIYGVAPEGAVRQNYSLTKSPKCGIL